MIGGRQPAFWIGLVVTLIIGALSTLVGEGVVSDALAGQITDGVKAVAELAVLVAPLIAGLLIRREVTPTTEPKLPVGTPVLVDRPAGQPDDTPPPDAVVALRSQLR